MTEEKDTRNVFELPATTASPGTLDRPDIHIRNTLIGLFSYNMASELDTCLTSLTTVAAGFDKALIDDGSDDPATESVFPCHNASSAPDSVPGGCSKAAEAHRALRRGSYSYHTMSEAEMRKMDVRPLSILPYAKRFLRSKGMSLLVRLQYEFDSEFRILV